MKAPHRRDRDDRRSVGSHQEMTAAFKNKKGKGTPNMTGIEDAEIVDTGIEDAEIVDNAGSDSVKVRSGNSRNIMNYGQKIDSNGYTDQVREYMAATDEKATADANDEKRKKGKTKVVKIDSRN